MLKVARNSEPKSMTTGMRLDVDAIPEGEDIVAQIEFLKNIKSFQELHTGFLDKNKLVKYIVILYSDDSFLNTRIPIPLEDRKIKAAHYCGITIDEEVETKLFNLEDNIVLKLIQDFLITQNKNLWTEIVTTEQQYAEAIRLRLQPVSSHRDSDNLRSAELKKKLREECKIMVNDIKGYYNDFHQKDEILSNKVREKATTLEALAKPSSSV